MIPSLAPVTVQPGKVSGVSNARNGFFGIRIWSHAEAFAGVLAQERYEWAFKWRILIAAAAVPLTLALLIDPWFGLFVLFAPLVTRVPAVLRYMELRGHAIEVAVAVKHYGKDRDAYERDEAEVLSAYYDSFDGEEPAGIQANLAKLRGWADKWADSHGGMIRKDMP